MTGYGGHVLFLLVQSISPPLCTHSINILNLIVCRTFLSKLEQGQKECDRCVYAQFMLRDNMGVVKRGDFIHEITLAHKMLRNYVIFVVSWCLFNFLFSL
jgi:hypothetical protein